MLPATRSSRVELPHPAEALVVERAGLVPVRHESLAPVPERLGVVQAPDLNVGDQQTAPLDGRHRLAEGRYVAPGKMYLEIHGLVAYGGP